MPITRLLFKPTNIGSGVQIMGVVLRFSCKFVEHRVSNMYNLFNLNYMCKKNRNSQPKSHTYIKVGWSRILYSQNLLGAFLNDFRIYYDQLRNPYI